ncbi:uncharacterized protein LOC126787613 isoform X1 [Argentina anserina]|uniref:uncharacterized protein LOC126787613 isoform X1 n=1 Tax=Argentina anserina TaxID=57926 RepID=UPI002176771C|nr:uncharacterized protein LOC126787613 isoform X1 [Potentilla anserina]
MDESMETRVKESLRQLPMTQQQSEAMSRLPDESNIYDYIAVTGIRVDQVEPGLVVSTFKVPSRLTDGAGNLSNGAIANIVDIVAHSPIYVVGQPANVSVDISISYVSTAKVNDELEITSTVLGQRGRYSAILVCLKNKATGEIIAEGRHSMFLSKVVPKL